LSTHTSKWDSGSFASASSPCSTRPRFRRSLAVAHASVAVRGVNAVWLVALYFVLMVVPMVVAIAGLLDTWVELRGRVRPTRS